jgi:CxxC-x17-CxxC domain-containing protein
MFNDKTLVCKDCSQEFVFTAREQEFYASKGFQNEPLRCKECRDQKKSQFNRDSGPKKTREMYDAVCAECGRETKVPFKPHLEKPVYCSECFSNSK